MQNFIPHALINGWWQEDHFVLYVREMLTRKLLNLQLQRTHHYWVHLCTYLYQQLHPLPPLKPPLVDLLCNQDHGPWGYKLHIHIQVTEEICVESDLFSKEPSVCDSRCKTPFLVIAVEWDSLCAVRTISISNALQWLPSLLRRNLSRLGWVRIGECACEGGTHSLLYICITYLSICRKPKKSTRLFMVFGQERKSIIW